MGRSVDNKARGGGGGSMRAQKSDSKYRSKYNKKIFLFVSGILHSFCNISNFEPLSCYWKFDVFSSRKEECVCVQVIFGVFQSEVSPFPFNG